jgi:hypothetical protein
MKKYLLFTLLVIAVPTAAQTAQKDILVKHWKTSGDFTIAVANAMPADGYTFRPTPEEMSFGELMAHIAALDRNACANASGLTPPALPAKIEEWVQDTVAGSGQRRSDSVRKGLLCFLRQGHHQHATEPHGHCRRATKKKSDWF